MTAPILVAGIGNIFFADDGFGVEVAARLARRRMPAGVSVVDFGIRGLHLAYELLEPYRAVIIADALARGEAPGTLYHLEPEPDRAPAAAGGAHGMCLPAVLATARSLGATVRSVAIVGCEPETVSEGIGLSPAVERAIEPAIELIAELVTSPSRVHRKQPERS